MIPQYSSYEIAFSKEDTLFYKGMAIFADTNQIQEKHAEKISNVTKFMQLFCNIV